MADNILPFPKPHRGDPDPRRMALAAIGFQWQAGLWRRGRVMVSDADIDAMEARVGAVPAALDEATAARSGVTSGTIWSPLFYLSVQRDQ